MSGTIVRIDQLDEAIKQAIDDMNQDVIQKCNEAGDKAAKDAAKMLKQTSPVRNDGCNRKYKPGSYAKSWGVTREGMAGIGVVSYTVHNKKHYQLTHLLEFGHIIAKTGGRSKSFPHIAEANRQAAEQFVRDVENMKL